MHAMMWVCWVGGCGGRLGRARPPCDGTEFFLFSALHIFTFLPNYLPHINALPRARNRTAPVHINAQPRAPK